MSKFSSQEYITKFNNDGEVIVRRIMDSSETKIKLVGYGWIEKEKCVPPLAVGDQVIYNHTTMTITDVPESEDGFSVRAYSKVTAKDGEGNTRYFCYEDGTNLNYIQLVHGDDSDPMEIDENPRVNEMKAFLRKAKYSFTSSVIKKTVEEAYQAKAVLREKFRKSKYWVEELDAIVVPDFKFNTEPDYSVVNRLARNILGHQRSSDAADRIYQATNEIIPTHLYKNTVHLNDHYADIYETNIPGFKYHPGAKVTRFLRSVFDGVKMGEVYDAYEQDYAALSDAASPSEHKRTLVISLNIMDFMTMSNGNSWTSCHNVVERGCYHGGTLSYALDGVTAILYTLNPDVDTTQQIWEIPKINRQLFMLGDTFVIESRLYPASGNDGNPSVRDMSLKKVHSEFVQKFYSEVTGKHFRSLGVVHSIINNREISHGLHYRDYEYSRYKCTALESDDYTNEVLNIGAESYDLVTGNVNHNERLLTSTNEDDIEEYPLAYEDWDTGYLISDDDDVVNYNGYIYNRENMTWCEYEECYCPDDEVIYINDEYYTPEYVDEHFVRCDICDSWENIEDIIEFDGENYCRSCAEEELAVCDECGEYYRYDDGYDVDDERICHDCFESLTQECSCCGEVHFKSYFADGVTVCLDCQEVEDLVSSVELPETGVVQIDNINELKKFVRIARAKNIKWRNGAEANDAHEIDVLRRTLQNEHITGIAIVINESLTYIPLTETITVPERFGTVVRFDALSNATIERGA